MDASNSPIASTTGHLISARAASASHLTQHVARAYFTRLSLSGFALPLIHHADLPAAVVHEDDSTLLLVRSVHPGPILYPLLARDIADSVVAAALCVPPAVDLADALAIKMAGATYVAAIQTIDPRRASRIARLARAAVQHSSAESRRLLSAIESTPGLDELHVSEIAAEVLASTQLMPSRWEERMEMLANKLPPFLEGDGPDAAADIAGMYVLHVLFRDAGEPHLQLIRRLVEKAIELAVYWSHG